MIKSHILDNIHLSDGRNITLETGFLAKQSNGSIIISMEDTVILATVVVSKKEKEAIDNFPLIVEYLQNNSAIGKIPGGILKREGRASEDEILTMRIVDRVLRPLFPREFLSEIQIIISLLSYDYEVIPNSLAALAASAALAVSNIPFYGPISEVRLIRKIGGKIIINPNIQDIFNYDIDIIVGGSLDSIIMIEGEMKEIAEEEIIEVIIFAHKSITLQIEAQVRLAKRVKISRIKKLSNFIQGNKDFLNLLKEKEEKKIMIHFLLQNKRKEIRDFIISKNFRIDGRTSKEIRILWSIVNYIPSAHGSALFMRGKTQSLTTVTLGSSIDDYRISNTIKNVNEKFFLHYKFPPFSTGEIRPLRGLSRRELGHGNLAQLALKNIIPENTLYTIRIVSDILESNGSSSMATVCAGTLALMDAGVFIKKPVSGISIGLIMDKKKNKEIIISDILGDEDYMGDMDLKIAGTQKGITACQMDIKIKYVSFNVLKKALVRAYQGRISILKIMLKTLSTPRLSIKSNNPKILNLNFPKESIGSIIGTGGKNIQYIQKKTNTILCIKEKGELGIVEIFGKEDNKINQAFDWIKTITFILELGGIYNAKVKSLKDFGVFVEIFPGKEFLLHKSEINWNPFKKIKDLLKIGDIIQVKYMGIDNISRKIKISRKVLFPNLYIKK